jgi:hypothetical protein
MKATASSFKVSEVATVMLQCVFKLKAGQLYVAVLNQMIIYAEIDIRDLFRILKE